MAHFAELDENNFVIRTHFCDNQTLLDENGEVDDNIGLERLKTIFKHDNFVQTSRTNRIRGKFAGKGDKYYSDLDVFVKEDTKFYNTDVIDVELGMWVRPQEKPEKTEEVDYKWNQTEYETNGNGWIAFDLPRPTVGIAST